MTCVVVFDLARHDVELYGDAQMLKPAALFHHAGNGNKDGIAMTICGQTDNTLMVLIGHTALHIRKGMAVVYDIDSYYQNKTTLYELPDMTSPYASKLLWSGDYIPLLVYGYCDKWLYVVGIDAYGGKFEGWLPPEKQHASMFSVPC